MDADLLLINSDPVRAERGRLSFWNTGLNGSGTNGDYTTRPSSIQFEGIQGRVSALDLTIPPQGVISLEALAERNDPLGQPSSRDPTTLAVAHPESTTVRGVECFKLRYPSLGSIAVGVPATQPGTTLYLPAHAIENVYQTGVAIVNPETHGQSMLLELLDGGTLLARNQIWLEAGAHTAFYTNEPALPNRGLGAPATCSAILKITPTNGKAVALGLRQTS